MDADSYKYLVLGRELNLWQVLRGYCGDSVEGNIIKTCIDEHIEAIVAEIKVLTNIERKHNGRVKQSS